MKQNVCEGTSLMLHMFRTLLSEIGGQQIWRLFDYSRFYFHNIYVFERHISLQPFVAVFLLQHLAAQRGWTACCHGKTALLYPTSFTATSLHQDLEQESQRRTREVETLEQQLSKAAADTWPDETTLSDCIHAIHAILGQNYQIATELSPHSSNWENEIKHLNLLLSSILILFIILKVWCILLDLWEIFTYFQLHK